ncbi:MAG TPA: flagellar export protein FliJ [Longimicrobiaceae bacterium]
MMFRFRLQRVLDLRVQSEQEAATRLAEARSEEEAARQERLRLEAARIEGMEKAAAASSLSPTIGQLQNLRFLVDRLTQEIAATEDEIAAAEADVREKLEAYSTAFRERQMIDKLREKALDAHRDEETNADRKLMDSVAIARFVRTRATRAPRGS